MSYDDEDDEGGEISREDWEADEADRKLKILKEEGTYWAWQHSRLSIGEFNRDQAEREYERAKADHARRLAEDRRWDGES